MPTPLVIRRVEERDGTVLFAAPDPSGTRAISDASAFLMADMMADVIDAGTAARVRSLGFTLPAAGKTGTTNDYHDAWFVGFTPTLVAGVWVGFDQPRTILPGGFASDVAVPVWTAFMKGATRGEKARWLPVPRGVVTARICRLSGHLATDDCEHAGLVDDEGRPERNSMVYTEYFARGTIPDATCDLHGSRGIFGAIAAVFTGDTEAPRGPNVEAVVLPPVTITSAPQEPAAVGPLDEPPKKKRGFWSRVLGIGGGRDDRRGKNPKDR